MKVFIVHLSFIFTNLLVGACAETFYLRFNNQTAGMISNHMDERQASECLEELTCRIEMVDVEYGSAPPDQEDEEEDDPYNDQEEENAPDDESVPETFVCRLTHRVGSYDIALPLGVQQEYVKHLQQSSNAQDASFYVTITDACVNEQESDIAMSSTSQVTWFVQPNGRRLGSSHRQLQHGHTMGTRLALVLRVSYLDLESSLSASQLQGRVFGRGPDKVDVSVRSHMEACSRDQLKYRVKRGAGIEHGIAEIRITEPMVFGHNPQRQLENKAMQLAQNQIGKLDRIDHILIVLPSINKLFPGGQHYFVAYGYLLGQVTVFNDKWGGYYSSLAHELGHNAGLHHSYFRDDPYGDTTGIMGYSYNEVSGPAYCFNAQKHYTLGWFDARTRRVDVADLPWSGHLSFFGDYSYAPHDLNYPVLIHMSRPGRRLFLQYNLAEGINEGAHWKKNRVIVQMDKAKNPGDHYPIPSQYRGSIAGSGGVFRFHNYHDSQTLAIRVCGRVGGPGSHHLRLSIYLEGVQQHTCGDEPAYFCDDDLTSEFYVDEARGHKDCHWLRQNLSQDNNNLLCVNTNDAYHICSETCGKCSDSCDDSPSGSFRVHGVGQRDCAWLATNRVYQDKLCYSGHAAFELCPETCDRCDSH